MQVNDPRDFALETAQRYGIPGELFLSLIQQESSWRPDAVSPKGAIGFAQLMPGTARDLGVDPTDWRQNIEGGARYLRKQFDDFGSWENALQAYNAGPGNFRKYGGNVPFEETRNYVANIMARVASGKDVANDAMVALGRAPSGGGGTMQPGLLSPASAGSTQQAPDGFLDRLRANARSGELFDNLAVAFNSMRLNPDPNISAIAERRATSRSDARTRNRTAEFLRARGREDLAAAVESGAIGGQTAVQLAYQEPKDTRTALQQNYEFLIGQGLSPEDALGALRSGTTVNMPGEMLKIMPDGSVAVADPAAEGGVRFVTPPNSPAAAKAVATEEQAGMRAESAARSADIVLDEIGSIRRKMEGGGLPTTGLLGGLLSNIGGTNAGDIAASIDTISGNIAFDRLQQMREASPTGGALGAVTERELALLSSVLGSLNQTQSAEQFNRNLTRLEEIYSDIMRKAQAYPNAAEFGFGGGGAAPAVTLSPEARRYLEGN